MSDNDKISNSFNRKLLYRQKDIGETEQGSLEANSSIWAVNWLYEGLTSPLSSRLKVNIVTMGDVNDFLPISADIEIWNNYEWKILDICYQGANPGKSLDDVEQECLCMAESFLMGTAIEEIRKKHGLHIDETPPEKDIKELNKSDNVLAFTRKKD